MMSDNRNVSKNPLSSQSAGAHILNGSQEVIQQLRDAVQGRLITPEDPEYDQARTTFYGGFDKHPVVIVRVANAADVAEVINTARQSGLPLAVRSGGHSSAGHSVADGGIVIDLHDMRSLEIDPQNRTVWAETGLTAGDVTNAAEEYGLAVGFGDTGSVGIGGITLGGGVGYLSRKYGLTIDNLLAAEVVTADGQIRRVDANHHPDLFWAIRGGGGNFGVVTRFQYRLQDVSSLYGGMLFLPATPEVIAGFVAEAEAAPEELSTIANVMPAPPMPFVPKEAHGKMLLIAMMVYNGPAGDGERILAPFRKLAQPFADMLRPIKYSEMFPAEEGGYHPSAVGHNMYIDHVGLAEAETMLRYLQESDAPMRVVQLRVLGGAIARVPAGATAYAHRTAKIMANIAAFYTKPEEKAVREDWVAQLGRELYQGVDGAYVNFLDDEDSANIQSAYPPETYQRLAEIKARYDPDNLFHHNQNIEPVRA